MKTRRILASLLAAALAAVPAGAIAPASAATVASPSHVEGSRTGAWAGTDPAALNRLAATLDPTATPAYLPYRPAPYPRPLNLSH